MKQTNLRIHEGDTLTMYVSGGGGYGDPFTRDPALVGTGRPQGHGQRRRRGARLRRGRGRRGSGQSTGHRSPAPQALSSEHRQVDAGRLTSAYTREIDERWNPTSLAPAGVVRGGATGEAAHTLREPSCCEKSPCAPTVSCCVKCIRTLTLTLSLVRERASIKSALSAPMHWCAGAFLSPLLILGEGEGEVARLDPRHASRTQPLKFRANIRRANRISWRLKITSPKPINKLYSFHLN